MNDTQRVMVVCISACSVPTMSIISRVGETREVTKAQADILVGMGRFKILEDVNVIPVEEKEIAQEKETSVYPDKYIEGNVTMPNSEVNLINVNQSEQATPSAISLAKEYNIDLSLIKGTGLGGKITKGDVTDYKEHMK